VCKFCHARSGNWSSRLRGGQNIAPNRKPRWLSGLESAINNLGDDPDRYPLAAESDAFDFPLRQLNYGVSRHPTHRVLFAVHADRVLIYALRHLAQQELALGDLV